MRLMFFGACAFRKTATLQLQLRVLTGKIVSFGKAFYLKAQQHNEL